MLCEQLWKSGKCIEYIFLASFSSKILNWLDFKWFNLNSYFSSNCEHNGWSKTHVCCNQLIPKLWALFVYLIFLVRNGLFKTFFLWWCRSVCGIKSTDWKRFHELNFTSFAPQEDAEGTVWLNDKTTFGGEREIKPKLSSRRSWRGQLETFRSSFKDGKLCRTEWNGLNLRLKEHTCERTRCWTGRENPPLYCTLL